MTEETILQSTNHCSEVEILNLTENERNYLKRKFINITKGTKYVTNIVNTLPLNIPFHDDYIEMLLKCHPNSNKIKNIEYLVVRIRPPFKRKALFIKNKCEEKEDDVSYKYCLRALFNKYNKKENNISRIMRTFRDVVSNTKKKEFWSKITSDNICEECGTLICDKLHIDHFKYTFQQLLDEFIGNNKIIFASIKVFENEGKEYEFEDKELQMNWINYHDNKVIFKALCKTCNLSNGTYGYKKNNELY